VLVDKPRHSPLEIPVLCLAGGRLTATPLHQPLPQIGGQRLRVALGCTHARINPAGIRNAPTFRGIQNAPKCAADPALVDFEPDQRLLRASP
jgi:hypothetical protein